MDLYPAFLDLGGRLVLLAGGGEVAARKLRTLLAAGAGVRLVSPELSPAVRNLAEGGEVEYIPRTFRPADLTGVSLCIAATSDPEANREIAREAKARGVFVNLASSPEEGDFQVPSAFRRGSLTVAVSTGGASPAVARKVRLILEEALGPEWGPGLRILAAVRRRVTAGGGPARENREVFYRLVDSPLWDMLSRDDLDGVDRLLESVLGPGLGIAGLGLDRRELGPEPGGSKGEGEED